MERIADDPIVRHIERTGYPPWWKNLPDDDEDFSGEDDSDVFYGNSSEAF